MNSIAIIPARGGSKGIPKKNIKKINGKPLIHYTIEAARKVFNDDNIVVSTDSHEIKEVVEQTGLKVPFVRSAHLATDTANSRDVILDAIDFYENKNKIKVDVIVLLQPTSPLRNEHHIREALSLWDKHLDMVVSVRETRSNPYYILFEENSEGYLEKSKKGNYTRRQDCPSVWEYNGAIYICSAEKLRTTVLSDFTKVKKYVMDERSSIDIDEEIDLLIAKSIIEKGMGN